MTRYDMALFDLDGTLTEPAEGITASVAYALKKFGIEVGDNRELYKFIGPPLIESFIEFYGFDRPKAELAVTYYREYFTAKGMFQNKVYKGIPEALEMLKNAGVEMAVTTSKPEPFAIEILKRFNLYKYFVFVGGATLDEKRTKKEEVIAYVLANTDCKNKRCVVVGDRLFDVRGAKLNGLESIGVLFGYGSLRELEDEGATYIANTPLDMAEIICKI